MIPAWGVLHLEFGMVTAVEFDFRNKEEREIGLESISVDPGPGVYYWLRCETSQVGELQEWIDRLQSNSGLDVGGLEQDDESLVQLTPEYLSFVLSETRFSDGLFSAEPLRLILGNHFLITIAAPRSPIIRHVLSRYRQDFLSFAQSPGFLLFEIIDVLCLNHQRTYRSFESVIDRLQTELFEQVNKRIFIHVARTMKQMLLFHFSIVDSREIISSIATRKSPFISETTQPFLGSKADFLGRLGADLSTQRDVIADTLNLYVGFVSHETNHIINRLTIISLIFLPLTFLVGVYGMNFKYMPELDWIYGYPSFWVAAVMIVISLVLYFRHKKWLDL